MSLTITTGQAQYYARPQDERFPSIDAMIASAVHDKNLSSERTYTLKDLAVLPSGDDLQLRSPRGVASLSHWSFAQLCRTVGAPASYLRERLSPELAARCLNHGFQDSPAGTDLRLLVRGQNGQPPLIRAATSDSYGRVWDADLYGAIDRFVIQPGAARSAGTGRWTLPPTWDGRPAGAYRGDRDSFLIVVDGGSIVPDPSLRNARGAGSDAMYRALLVRNSEVGAASIVIESILFRAICGNHLIMGAVYDRTFKRRHVGKDAALRDTIREIGTIAHRWSNQSPARDAAIIEALISHEIAATKDGVIDQLRAMGATAEQAAAAYATAERTEPASPRSWWGIAQGLTRLSQETGSGYEDHRYEIDRIAGAILARGAKVAA